MQLTELVEALCERGTELDEPNPRVRIWAHGAAGPAWFEVEAVLVSSDRDAVILFTGEPLNVGRLVDSTKP
ncbi:MAG TPA: hypothetical protein VFJ25_04610 [Casimicrobiaceae bacterium]|nr:hypothetical protein [Casimicrobiaceae bacterium]